MGRYNLLQNSCGIAPLLATGSFSHLSPQSRAISHRGTYPTNSLLSDDCNSIWLSILYTFFLMSLTFTWYPLYCTCALLNLLQVLHGHSSDSEHGEQKKLPGLSLGGNRLMFCWERVTWASQKLTVIGRNWTKVGTCVYECIDSTANT